MFSDGTIIWLILLCPDALPQYIYSPCGVCVSATPALCVPRSQSEPELLHSSSLEHSGTMQPLL